MPSVIREQHPAYKATTSGYNSAGLFTRRLLADRFFRIALSTRVPVSTSVGRYSVRVSWSRSLPRKTREVTKTLLKEIIPRFGVLIGMSSDRGPYFIAEIRQQWSKIQGIRWDLYTPWQPQSSRKAERMTQTLKMQISKICQETSLVASCVTLGST